MKCLLLDLLRTRSCSELPIWLMRQAGRYLPEYQELKADHGFLGLCENPELAAEITLQPLRRFRPDASIIFADIMLPARCIGFSIDFAPGPVVHNQIEHPERIADIEREPDLAKVRYVFEAISRVKEALPQFDSDRGRIGLFGFAAAPWTLACYLLKQEPYKHFAGTRIFAARHPEAFDTLLDTICELSIQYCRAQVEAGADVIQIFDSWAGLLSCPDFSKISMQHTERLIRAIQPHAPVVLFANGSSHLLPALAASSADALSVDWRTSLRTTAELAKDKSVQGNLDPGLLFASEENLAAAISEMLAEAPPGRYIANLGHGVLQKTPIPRVAQFIQAVQAHRW